MEKSQDKLHRNIQRKFRQRLTEVVTVQEIPTDIKLNVSFTPTHVIYTWTDIENLKIEESILLAEVKNFTFDQIFERIMKEIEYQFHLNSKTYDADPRSQHK